MISAGIGTEQLCRGHIKYGPHAWNGSATAKWWNPFVKSRWQMLAFFRRVRAGEEPFENIDHYFPFYVETGSVVTLGTGKSYKFPERKVFEDIEAMVKYVKTHDNSKSMLVEADNDVE